MPNLQRDDLRAANRLLVEATVGTTDLVDAVHASVLGWPRRIVGLSPQPASGGIPGLVYAAIRGIARLAGDGVDLALRQLPAAPGDDAPDPQREALVAALNGVLGDHLVATGNPLAIAPSLRKDGRSLALEREALARAFPAARGGLLVMIHGLCMNDLQWRQAGHDHGAALADALGRDVVHLHYNTGLPIADNGRALDALLQALIDAWPVPVERLALVGHSMGGLVARAAIAHAQDTGSGWLAALTDLATLGTPHHGAALERAGHLLEQALGVSAHSAPFAALGKLRSAGIRDLRHGGAHLRQPPLPANVRAHVIAGSTAATSTGTRHPRGDGLVSVASAFGEHRDPRRRLALPDDHKRLVHGTGHIALLGSPGVYAQLRAWLA
ncbi:permease [Thermomonas brevis]